MSCNAKKDPNGTWRIQYRWTDWTGTKKKSQNRWDLNTVRLRKLFCQKFKRMSGPGKRFLHQKKQEKVPTKG